MWTPAQYEILQKFTGQGVKYYRHSGRTSGQFKWLAMKLLA